MFYLRPCFYKHLDPEVRPPGWEAYAEADEIVWQRELAANPRRSSDNEEGRSPDKMSSTGSVTSDLNDSQLMEDDEDDNSVDADDASGTGEEASGLGEDVSGSGEDPMDTGDETEDEE